MRLSQVEHGKKFTWQNKVLTHDHLGRSGGRQVAVRDVETGKQYKLAASTEVELLKENEESQGVEDDLNEGETVDPQDFVNVDDNVELNELDEVEVEDDKNE